MFLHLLNENNEKCKYEQSSFLLRGIHGNVFLTNKQSDVILQTKCLYILTKTVYLNSHVPQTPWQTAWTLFILQCHDSKLTLSTLIWALDDFLINLLNIWGEI